MGIGFFLNISYAFRRNSRIQSGSFFRRAILSTISRLRPFSLLYTYELSSERKPYLYSSSSNWVFATDRHPFCSGINTLYSLHCPSLRVVSRAGRDRQNCTYSDTYRLPPPDCKVNPFFRDV